MDGTIGSVEVAFADGSRRGVKVAAPPGELFTNAETERAVRSLIDHGEFFGNVDRLPSHDGHPSDFLPCPSVQECSPEVAL